MKKRHRKFPSQNDLLFEWLKEHKTIEEPEARRQFNIGALHSRITDLREDYGCDIKTLFWWERDRRTGYMVKRYRYLLVDYIGREQECRAETN